MRQLCLFLVTCYVIQVLLQSWHALESSSIANMDKFIDYFSSRKVAVIRDSMLRQVREECGLGCPPDNFTTNASESVNAMLKHKVNYKRNELPVFIEKVRELIKEQQQEVERAIIGRGKFQFREHYKHL